MATDYSAIKKHFSRVIEDPSLDFNSEALTLFDYQFQTNTPYRAYCQHLGITPHELSHWREIPALPGNAFKFTPPPFCGPLKEATRHFLSSGTTQEIKSAHYFRETESYESSILAGWSHAQLPDLSRRAFLFQRPEQLPHSSLAHMFETLARGNEASWLINENGTIDTSPLLDSSEPLLLFATSLTLLQLINEHPQTSQLPQGSWVFQTGGFKGLGNTINPKELSLSIEKKLGIFPDHIINEYGMTELSSQAYSIGVNAPYQCPPWLRYQIINPETGLEQTHGENGYLHLYDLANLSSALALRTQDIAQAVNEHSFILHGRDPEALPRGCSRTEFSSLTLE